VSGLSAEQTELVAAARSVRDFAYAPYSNFRVGAALRADSGRIYVGCNVENASYGATICAERSAVMHMVSSGDQRLTMLAVFTEADTLTMPCGMCRQVLSEFGIGATVIVANRNEQRIMTLRELFPEPFVFER
jgi:cytidine deaminase